MRRISTTGSSYLGILFIAFLLSSTHGVFAQPTSATKADSGWVSLFNGTNFTGFYIFSKETGAGIVDTQKIYRADSGMIHSPSIPNSEFHLITNKEYSYYKVRVDYRWGPITGSQNAGMVIHIDNTLAHSGTLPAGTLRPTSIEVQMLRTDNNNNSPSTLWSAVNLGPYITSTVQSGTNNYLTGGVAWINDPWGGAPGRTLYTTVANPENPVGQWNRSQAEVYGDSGGFYLNGVLRTRGWHFQVRGSANDASVANRKRYGKGSIGLQQEGNEIWYRNFEIMELDSATRMPINATRGCTNRSVSNYNPRAVVDNGTCSTIGIHPSSGKASNGFTSGSVLFLDRAGLKSILHHAPAGFKWLRLYTLEGKRLLSVAATQATGSLADQTQEWGKDFRPGSYFLRWSKER